MRTTRLLLVATVLALPATLDAATATILGWNNLGMHCMDSDYSVFSVLPPYNTIEGQLIINGRLITNAAAAGYTVTYQAVADSSGSFNSTAMGKNNFYTYSQALYGTTPPPERGLLSWSMPGLNNTPQSMLFENTNSPAPGVATLVNWFRAEGIPISPFDDAMKKNPYPLMRMIAWNSANQPVATNDVVLPVSDEMDCRACHASGTQEAARPAAGWLWNGLPERDYRLNILRLHDEKQLASHRALYEAALADRGFNPAGLYRSVTVDNKPVLCAACHASEALGAPSYPGVPSLTASVHFRHADVMDPDLKTTLNDSANRMACYRCHPGSTTRCLRGAMGGAIASDGSMSMQCQSCHGNMQMVGATDRVGWFMEPNCQSCHSGTATHNNGKIRYDSVFTSNGTVRVAVNNTFATQPNTPAPGISLYRFSIGHGGLQCSACHGSTHAEFPSTHGNDNLRNIRLQGHAGVMVECTACHTTTPNTPNGGPHGMHAIDQGWITGSDTVTKHADRIESLGGSTACQPCHGTDYRGTVLSRAQSERSFRVSLDGGSFTLTLHRGQVVGCYNCHQGPESSDLNSSTPPTVTNLSTNTTNDKAVAMTLPITGAGAAAQILSQPANGSVGLSNGVATYFPSPGFIGTDTFTFSAYDGAKNSIMATGTVTVAQGPWSFAVSAYVPPTYPAGWPVAFVAVPSVTNHAAPVTFDWNFGDGSIHATDQYPAHSYAAPGEYTWSITCTVAGVSATRTGTIIITIPMILTATKGSDQISLTWPNTLSDSLVEGTELLGPAAQWRWVTNSPSVNGGALGLSLPISGKQYFRLRRPW